MRSFGGYFAVKLALVNPDVKAVINACGPITFGDGVLWPIPPFIMRTIAAGFGMDQCLFGERKSLSSVLNTATTNSLQGPPVNPAISIFSACQSATKKTPFTQA